MKRINIWEDSEQEVTEIGFNPDDSSEYIQLSEYIDENGKCINIMDINGDYYALYLSQIDMVIKALHKAKQLWGDK